MKYRIKLKTGRIIGPFSLEQVGELFVKGHVDGTEECQLFPVGEWMSIKDNEKLSKHIFQLIENNVSASEYETEKDSKTVVNISLSKKKKDNKVAAEKAKTTGGVAEFNYEDEETDAIVDYDELEEKYKDSKGPEGSKVIYQQEAEEVIEEVKAEEEKEEEPDFEKTVVVKRKAAPSQDFDKTQINPDTVKFLEEQRKLEEEKKKVEAKKEKQSEKEENAVALKDEATQFVNINELLPDIKNAAQETELAIEQADAIEEEEATVEESKTESEEEAPKKKKMKPIVALAFFVIIAFLMFPDDKNGNIQDINPVHPKIVFPISLEFEDLAGSNEELRKGKELYSRSTYISKIKASTSFRKSLEHKFKNNKALGHLILTYAELLPNAKDKSKAGRAIFRLTEIARSKLLTDVNVAVGTALYYSYFDNKKTALNILENYLRIGKPTVRFLVEYLNLLIDIGNLPDARKAFNKLKALANPPFEAYLSMAKFLSTDEQHDEAMKMLEEASRKYSKPSVKLLLTYADYILRNQDYKRFLKILKAVQELQAERSPVYYSKYLEYMGILSAYNGDNVSAVNLFQEALKQNDNIVLRSKLASLEIGGSKSVQTLIMESKVKELMRKSRVAADEKEWDTSFRYAIDAVDLMEGYVPARLLLSNVQTRRGYYDAAIKSLVELYNEFPLDPKINFELVNTYLGARMLADAKKQIFQLGTSKLKDTYEYASLMGRYYDRLDNVILAVRWYRRAIQRNPLSDDDCFMLAKMLLRYNKFKDAKKIIRKALNLDPENVEYKVFYSKILYEFSSADTAIGYLREMLEERPNHPQILAQIAVYYHKNGMIRSYERMYEKIFKMQVIDGSFYEFLIKAAKLDDKPDDVIKYSSEFIKINPGNLEARMSLGEFLIENRRFAESEKVFNGIAARLVSYPKVNYYLAKIRLTQRRFKEALKFADSEIKYNGGREFGYYIKGEVLKAMRKYPESIKMMEQAIARNGKSVEVLMSFAWIKAKQSYLEESKELYLRALREDASHAEAHKQLAYVYKAMGQSILAIESFKVYLNLLPNAKDKSIILREIRALK